MMLNSLWLGRKIVAKLNHFVNLFSHCIYGRTHGAGESV